MRLEQAKRNASFLCKGVMIWKMISTYAWPRAPTVNRCHTHWGLALSLHLVLGNIWVVNCNSNWTTCELRQWMFIVVAKLLQLSKNFSRIDFCREKLECGRGSTHRRWLTICCLFVFALFHKAPFSQIGMPSARLSCSVDSHSGCQRAVAENLARKLLAHQR